MFRKRVVKKSPTDKKNQKKRQKIDFNSDRPVAGDGENDLSDHIPSVKVGSGERFQPPSEDLDKYTLTVNDDSTKEDFLNSERKELAKNVKKERLNGDNELVLNMSGKSAQATKQINQPTNIRTTVLMDFQPDICKDFRQTGYCGYGDSCKFLHSRDDFKAGWKLNQEWNVDEEDSSKATLNLDKVPFKCVLCKEDYKSPVVTSCGHYFCGSCFVREMKKGTKCFICHKETHGSAKVATDLQKVISKRKT
ncbi:cwc24p [Saccharomyces arboricola H-6]|uniref:Pre-mRNA-splicing factor CWC24 n=1 Tax=Saccharomyces arboricola (strain H-6 / AS 2.3317 / CBS 10644) TaxID=1160507 RepID=J8Q1Q8_SACAR|nr:cwc24p [Saccharomyces arboricola H-6]